MDTGISHIGLDDLDVWCIEDGTHTFNASDFPGCGFDEQQSRLAAAGETSIRTVFNAYLIKDKAGNVTMLDAGCGSSFGDSGGALFDRLATLGVHPSDVTKLIFGHMHRDHCSGAIADGKATFPNATIYLHNAEHAYWTTQEAIGATVFAAYEDRITTVEDGTEIAPGITFWALPGHTPGHSGLRVGGKLAIIGDVMHSEALQIGDPRLCSVYDMDHPTAIDTRMAALAEVADDGLIWSGSHMLGPDKFARLVQIGDGYIRISL